MTKRDFLRYSFVFLTFLGVFSTYPKAVHQARAEEPVGDVIYISTPQEFQDINLDLTAHYEIVNDIDFTGFILSPIAVNGDFTGELLGNNHKLSNLIINLPSFLQTSNNSSIYFYYGLFINNNGLIQDLIFENVSIKSTNFSIFIEENNFESIILVLSSFIVFNKSNGVIKNNQFSFKKETIELYPQNGQEIESDYWFSLYYSYLVFENYGLIENLVIDIDNNNSWIQISEGYRDIEFFYSFIHKNYGAISKIKLLSHNKTHLFIHDFSYSYIGGLKTKTIYISLIVNFNYGSISEIIVKNISEYFIDIEHSNFGILFSSFVNNSYGGVISSVRIINSKFLWIDYSSPLINANHAAIHINVILNELFNTVVSNILVEENSVISVNLNSSSPAYYIYISPIGTNNTGSYLNFISIIGFLEINYAYYLHPRNQSHPYFNNNYNFATTTNLSTINTFYSDVEVVFVDRTSSLLKNYTNIGSFNNYGSNYNVLSARNEILNYLFYREQTLGASKIYLNYDDIAFGNYFGEFLWSNYQNDKTYEDIYVLFEHDLSWTTDQLNLKDFPIPTFSLISFGLSNGVNYEIGVEFRVESIEVILQEQLLEIGTYYLFYAGNYSFKLNSPLQSNKLDIQVDPNLNLLTNFSIYNGSLAININGESNLMLDSENYIEGTPITTPGLHTLTIFGENGYEQEITFTIVLETDGVTDESTYTDSVTPTFSGGTATLNGEPFESGTEITDVGNYTLIILGVNGFREEINFKILPVITGLQDGVTKDPGFQPNITGEGITLELNGDPYTIGTPITTPGLHTLTIFGENGYDKDITFTIRLIFNGVSDNQTIVNDDITITFSGGQALLNDDEIQTGFTTNKLGNYRLVIFGVGNEIMLDYEFTILPEVQGLNHSIYTGNVQPNISGNSFLMTLNGVPYSGGNITMPGDHQLIIYGYTLDSSDQNEVMYTKDFRINVRVQNVANGENYLNQTKTIIISGGNPTLNGQSIGLSHVVTSIGHYLLVISGVNGYFHEVNFTISPEINGVDNRQEYISSTNIQVLGVDAQVTLNGNSISNGILTYPGQHELVISGVGNFEVRRTFSIVATIDGVEDEAVYLNQPKTITFSGGEATLNGVTIQSGYILDMIGHFELTIAGVNGYSLTYNFTNLPEIIGVEESAQYNGSTDIQILGNGLDLLMNGQPFTSNVYSEPGQHVLEIFAAGNYYQAINFRIKPTISGGVLDGEIYINTTVNIVISGGSPTLNGVAIPLSHVVTEVGNYTLVIPQNNLPNVVITFTIDPAFTKLANNRTYNGSITPTISGQGITITLNGRPYVSATPINNPGANIIRITSANGDYLKVINFTVNLVFSGLVDGFTYYDLITPSFSGGVVTLNGEPFESDTTITTLGDFELLIIGDNNYARSYTFTILPYNMSFPLDGASREEVNLNIYRVHSLTEITLNEVEIRETKFIQAIGHYDLVITYNGETISDTRFTVEPQDYIEDGSEFTSPIDIYHPHAIVKINGQEVSRKYRIDIQKQYTIEVFGVNDYYHTYTIKFYNPNLQDYQQLIAPMVATAIGSMAIFLMRKRWVS